MKVWELVAKLMELPAGANVVCTAYPEGTVNSLVSVITRSGRTPLT